MMFAIRRLRCRKKRSGTRGESTRDSITRKMAMSAAAAPSSPSVCAEVQPFLFPLTIAYTAIISAATTEIAPAKSIRPRPSAGWSAGSSRSASRTTSAPIGTLTRKIQCQLSRSVSTPPSRTPMLPPPAATKPKSPIAFARSPAVVNSPIIKARETADAVAPPMPCTARADTSIHCVVDSPQTSEATVKSTIPPMNSLRAPRKSPSRPPSSRKPPYVSR